MVCPNCHAEQPADTAECGRCGIVFAKAKPVRDTIAGLPDVPISAKDDEAENPTLWVSTIELFLPRESNIPHLYLAGRFLAYVVLLVWGWHFIAEPLETNYAGESFMHNINLPFHEAGHLVFRPLGRFLTVLGGTIGQLLIPAICTYVLLVQTRDAFGAAVGLWWVARGRRHRQGCRGLSRLGTNSWQPGMAALRSPPCPYRSATGDCVDAA